MEHVKIEQFSLHIEWYQSAKNVLLHFEGNSVIMCKFSKYNVFVIDMSLWKKVQCKLWNVLHLFSFKISSGPNYHLLLNWFSGKEWTKLLYSEWSRITSLGTIPVMFIISQLNYTKTQNRLNIYDFLFKIRRGMFK